MPSTRPRQLIVEGADDLHSVVGLMRAHVDWPTPKDQAPVFIEPVGGADEILRDGVLSTFLKSPPIKILGVMLDADENATGRFQRFRELCVGAFPDLPKKMPAGGLVADNGQGKRLGLWVMPDNVSEGYMEVFLSYLVPNQQEPVWKHAIASVSSAIELQCGCREAHVSKANLFTWLAWQDPPGRSPGLALTHKVLDPAAPSASAFVKWFVNLYQL